MKLIMVDLDGTLFDTKEVNFLAYQEAIKPYGYDIDYKYYCEYCNGRHYLDFLPQITTTDVNVLKEMHERKKAAYSKHLGASRLNEGLLDILKLAKNVAKIVLVTTASKENTYDILQQFELLAFFDAILTHEDVNKVKPDPEGFIKAMEMFSVEAKDSIIFEDSNVGIEAAEQSGAQCFVVKGYN